MPTMSRHWYACERSTSRVRAAGCWPEQATRLEGADVEPQGRVGTEHASCVLLDCRCCCLDFTRVEGVKRKRLRGLPQCWAAA